jgi:hypothetical protein
MAITDSGFTFKRNIAGRTTGIRKSYIIGNSATITIGDMVKLSSGFIALAGANAKILGVVVAIEDANGLDLDNPRRTNAGGTWTSSSKTIVVAADNQTVDQIRAIVDIDPMSIWSAQPDNTIGTTTGSNLAGYYCDLPSASDQPDEDTTTTTVMQLFIWGLDPENTARGLYSIAEHQIWGT